jgi:hypothetical protein
MARQSHLTHLAAAGTLTLLTLLVVSRTWEGDASELEESGPPLPLSLPAEALPRHAGHRTFSPPQPASVNREHTRGGGGGRPLRACLT